MNERDEQAPVEQTREAVKEAIDTVKTPAQADRVIEHLEQAAAGKTEHEVAKQHPDTDAEQAAESVEQAAQAPAPRRAEEVIKEAATQIAAARDEEEEELIARAVQQATNPEASPDVPGVAPPVNEPQRQMLQEALLRRMNPIEAADTALFLMINHMPRSEAVNDFMYAVTTLMNRGDGWVLGLLGATLANPRRGRRALIDVLPSLWLTAATVEFPIKHLFRRRRPFISIVRAIVVGKKPGGFSFPSGHSAAAFAGALLLARHYPRCTPLFYMLAVLTGFTRIYLGAHYPGDVLTGAASGTALALLYRRLAEELFDALD
jgi:undecaprenyl-diphosphatase